jgi:hypothetical protein
LCNPRHHPLDVEWCAGHCWLWRPHGCGRWVPSGGLLRLHRCSCSSDTMPLPSRRAGWYEVGSLAGCEGAGPWSASVLGVAGVDPVQRCPAAINCAQGTVRPVGDVCPCAAASWPPWQRRCCSAAGTRINQHQIMSSRAAHCTRAPTWSHSCRGCSGCFAVQRILRAVGCSWVQSAISDAAQALVRPYHHPQSTVPD